MRLQVTPTTAVPAGATAGWRWVRLTHFYQKSQPWRPSLGWTVAELSEPPVAAGRIVAEAAAPAAKGPG